MGMRKPQEARLVPEPKFPALRTDLSVSKGATFVPKAKVSSPKVKFDGKYFRKRMKEIKRRMPSDGSGGSL